MHRLVQGALPVLAGVATLALLGTAGEASAKTLQVGPASFVPASSTVVTNYNNLGTGLAGAGRFLAPLSLPPNATVTRIEMRATDQDGTASAVHLTLTKLRVNNGTATDMASVASTEGSGIRGFATTAITGNPIGTGRATYLELEIDDADLDLGFVGAEIQYTVPSGG
jgi:hypothetical protein